MCFSFEKNWEINAFILYGNLGSRIIVDSWVKKKQLGSSIRMSSWAAAAKSPVSNAKRAASVVNVICQIPWRCLYRGERVHVDNKGCLETYCCLVMFYFVAEIILNSSSLSSSLSVVIE